MIENQSISKTERMDYQSCHDMLSELPLSIIHIILALVPFKDAVRTCILSRQWRYIWAGLPHLVFEDEYPASQDCELIFEKRIENFITNALFHHEGPIHKFKIHAPFISCNPDINEWILCLSRNDIRELIIHKSFLTLKQVVRSSIYSCEKLTNLELHNLILDPPPSTFKGFLFLRCLFLAHVFISHNIIESLVANSPLLESFSLLESAECESLKLRFSSPNLKYLYICGLYCELCVAAPPLAEMTIELFDDYLPIDHQEQQSCNYTNLMAGFTNLEKLSGFAYFTRYMSRGVELCHRTLVFHQLKFIKLKNVDFGDIRIVSVVARLIGGAPNLQTLKIHADDYTERDDEAEAPNLSFRDFGCTSNFMFENLRVVSLSHVRGLPLEMELIKFLLESSPVLEKMKLGHFYPAEAELMGFSWASPNAKISFS